ncbi:MAG: hypothetical protein WD250_14505 [Egibacteraceae bacterium]
MQAQKGLRFRQVATGTIPVLAGLLLIAGMAVTSWEEGGEYSQTAYYTALAAHPVRAQVSTILIGLGFLMLVPAFAAMAQLTRHRGTRLGNAGWLLGTIGFGLLGGMALVVDVYDTLLVTQLGLEQAVALGEALDEMVAPAVLGMTGAFGSGLGIVLMSAALWRSREVPVWVPALLLAGIVGFIVAPSATVPTVTAMAILTAGLLGVSLRILRAADWETGGPVRAAPRAGQPAARADVRVSGAA